MAPSRMLRQDHAEGHAGSSAEGDAGGRFGTRVEHQRPEQHAVDDHAPIHHLIELRIDHGAEMDVRDKPEDDEPDEQHRGDEGLLHDAERQRPADGVGDDGPKAGIALRNVGPGQASAIRNGPR